MLMTTLSIGLPGGPLSSSILPFFKPPPIISSIASHIGYFVGTTFSSAAAGRVSVWVVARALDSISSQTKTGRLNPIRETLGQ